MQLEKAIKQSKPFKSPYEKAIVNLIYTQNWISSEIKKHFKSLSITGKQYNILRILKGAGKPVSTSYIRERLLERLSDVSRVIDRMERDKLVVRKICKSDKRLVDLIIADKGEIILEKAESTMSEMHAILNVLSEKEINTLNNLLDKIRSK